MLATTSGQLVGTGTTAPLQPLGGTLQTSPFQPVPTAPPTTAPAPAPAPTATAAPAPAPYGTSQYGALPAAGAVYNTADGKWYPSGSYFSTNTGKMITINGQAAQPLAQQSLPATPTASGTGGAGPGTSTSTSSSTTNYASSPFAPLQQPLLTAGQNSLTGGQTAYNTGMDPQNALHDRTAQQLQDQVRTSEAARGITMSPYGAGVENTAMSNFNIDWQNNLLNRQVTGLNALNSSIGTGASLLDMGSTKTTNGSQTASPLEQQQMQANINRTNQLSAPAPSTTSEVMAPATPIPDWAKTATTGGAATTGGLLGFPTGGSTSTGTTGASPYMAAPPAPLSGGGYTGGGYAAPATSGGTAGGATAAQPSVAEAASVAAQYLLKTNEDVLNLASMLWAE